MNITKNMQYSRVMSGLRQPSKILDIQQKLVFIYPMLYCDKIKSPSQSFENNLRDFITITFLSDLFVQNSLSIVTMANQISPIWDEKKREIEKELNVVKQLKPDFASDSLYQKLPSEQYPITPDYKYDIQRKIEEKTGVIRKLAKTDPKLIKLRPHVEIVTLGNLIDVPIIMGTQFKTIDTLSTMYILIAAIGLGKRLTRENDIKAVCAELRTMTPDKYWKLLQGLFDNPKTDSGFFSQLLSNTRTKIGSLIPLNIRNKYKTLMSYFSFMREKNNEISVENQASIFEPLMLNKNQIDQIENFFLSVTNNATTLREIGLVVGENESSAISTLNLSEDFRIIADEISKYFEEYNNTYFLTILTSISKLITCNQIQLLNIQDIFNDAFDKTFYQKFRESIYSIFEKIDSIFKESGITSVQEQLKYLQKISNIKSTNTLTDFFKKLPKNYINTVEFTKDHFNGFMTYVDQFSTTGLILSSKIKDELEYVLSKMSNDKRPDLITHILTDFNNIEESIDHAIAKILKMFIIYLRDAIDLGTLPAVALLLNDLDTPTVKNKMVPTLLASAKNILKFIFYSQCQISLLSSVEKIDVKLQTKSYELTEWPNYFLVLPVEVISALYSATAGFNWKKMLRSDIKKNLELDRRRAEGKEIPKSENIRTVFNLNDNYIKGIVRFIVTRLDIPNLIVVDSTKSQIYCKLMNQSDVIKMKASTLETFIKSKLDTLLI